MSVLDWSSDGKWLVISRRPAANEPFGLSLLSIDTHEVRQLTSPPAGNYDYGAVFAPKGDLLAFLRNAGGPFLLPLTSTLAPQGAAIELPVKTGSSLRDLVWSADGREVFFSSGTDENAALWRASASGSPRAQRLRFAGEGVFGPSISRNGKRMVFERYSGESNIWSLGLDQNGRATSPAVKVFDSSKSEICPQFSPDGSRVAFESGRSGNSEIWVCQSDGANCAQLTSFGDTHAGSPAWSPDGNWIAFDVYRPSKSEVYVVNSNGGRPRLLTEASGHVPRWSRDGKWIYYRCGASPLLVEMAGETFEDVHICRVPADGGAPIAVTRSGGAAAQESPDRKWIYYSGRGANGRTTLRRIPIAGGDAEEVLPEIAGRNFAVVEAGIWYLTPNTSEGSMLRFFDFATKSARTVYRISVPVNAGLTISPDSRRILFTQMDRARTFDLMLVENFH
jgi:dipeptidyl aminopeptidase/acylaminoacyl peptidase